MFTKDIDVPYIADFRNVRRVSRVNNLGVGIVELVKKSLLDVGMYMGLWLFNQQEVSKRLLGLLIFEFQELERQVDEICSTQAQFMDSTFVRFAAFTNKQLQGLEQFVGFV